VSMNQTVLVVDDSPTVLKFVTYSLKDSGLKVVTASDGMDAVEKVSLLPGAVDLVITDLNMPNMDGYEFITTLRENEQYSATPIIILSSEEDEEDVARGHAAGADAYIMKPFKSSSLLKEVQRLLS